MSRDARSRVLLGIGIPVAALVFLGVLIFAFSRILLVLPPGYAPWVALLYATNILLGCGLAATIRGTRGFAFLIAVLIGTIVIGGIAGFTLEPTEGHSEAAGGHATEAVDEGENEPGLGEEPVASPTATAGAAGGDEQAGAGGEAAGGETPSLTAQGSTFDTSELSLPAGGGPLHFVNQDPVPHNVSIYTEQGGEKLFGGEVITGQGETDYQIPPLEPGSYFFQCDLHPTTMTGTVTVA